VEQQTDWKVCGEAENGRDGIDQAKRLHPDLILLDQSMPVMTGLEAARELLRRVLFEQALEERGERIAESDRKSALQELLQQSGRPPAEYRLAGETGPDHRKVFLVEVWADGNCLGSGEGKTKKEAEQQAARSALLQLETVAPKD